ncbi:hypothetical protein TNCV_4175821 [Trichonephila clavipes]|nr:hypothetical protein TNCV_4175821 [Trichonephila clavipes]
MGICDLSIEGEDETDQAIEEPHEIMHINRDSENLVAIEASNGPRLIGIVRGTALLHVLRRRPIVWPDSRRRSRECQM